MRDDLLGDGSICLHNNLVDLLGCLDRALLVVDPFELLQRTPLGLDGKEIPSNSLDDIPSDEDVDDLVLNVLEADGQSKLAQETHGRYNEGGGSQTLGSHGGLKSFSGDDTLQRCVGKGENNVEEEV